MKKLTQPIKFKRAIRDLISYLDASNGVGIDNNKEWNEEIAAWKNHIHHNDYKAFNFFIERLNILGLSLRKSYVIIDKEIVAFNRHTESLLNKIKW